MISYEESQKILYEFAKKSNFHEDEQVPLMTSLGRILNEDIICREDNPRFSNSAMDGYALRLDELLKYGDIQTRWLPVENTIAAGDTQKPGCTQIAVEIMTGAAISDDRFNTVIRYEDVIERRTPLGVKEIQLKKIPLLYENIRMAGEDSKKGSLLIPKGTQINSLHILMLASQGIEKVHVKRKIRIGIISTGKELVNFESQNLEVYEVRNSTTPYLLSEFAQVLTEVISFCHVNDDTELFKKELQELVKKDADIIVSTGAVSAGVFDFVRDCLESLRAEVHFHKCAIRPGKPVLFASLNDGKKNRYIFGLPGNPVSTVVGFTFFIKTFVNYLLEVPNKNPLMVALSNDIEKPKGLTSFLKAELSEAEEGSTVKVQKGQASFMLSPFRSTNAWVRIPEDKQYMNKQNVVEVYKI